MFGASVFTKLFKAKTKYSLQKFWTSVSVNTAMKLPEPEVLLTEYGELVNVKPMKQIKVPDERKYREVYMIDDNSTVKVILHTMDTKKDWFFMFDPEKMHYTNSMSIFRAIRANLYERYFGAKPEKQKTYEKKKKVKNAFSHWKTPLEIFHRDRNVKMNIAQELGRIGYFVDKGYQINIKGDNKPEIQNLKAVIQEKISSFNKFDSYKVPDYFLPVNMLLGLINSQEWQKNGVEIGCLENKLIYPYYGVWSPTSQEYLSLLDLNQILVYTYIKIKHVTDSLLYLKFKIICFEIE